MHQKISVDKRTVFTVVTIGLLIVCGCLFLYRVFADIVHPLFLAQKKEVKPPMLDPDFSQTVNTLIKYKALTGASASATLVEGEKFTAQILNGASIEGQATDLAEKLREVGIDVLEIGNSGQVQTDTFVRLKEKAFSLKDAIIDKIGTKSGSIQVENLGESDPFDIRIIIGR